MSNRKPGGGPGGHMRPLEMRLGPSAGVCGTCSDLDGDY